MRFLRYLLEGICPSYVAACLFILPSAALGLQIDYFPVSNKGFTKKTISFIGKSIQSGKLKSSPKNTGTEVVSIKKNLFNRRLDAKAASLDLRFAIASPGKGDPLLNHRSSLSLKMPLHIQSVKSPAVSIDITNSSYESNLAILTFSFKL